jgi:CTP:molybdopterin cytidylyltransferase MocA
MKIDAVLPAGGRITDELRRDVGAGLKALLPLGEETLLEHTLRALRATGRVRRIVVIGPDELVPHAGLADLVLPDAASGARNVLRGLTWLRKANGPAEADRALIVTTDLPFLTPSAVTGFLDACPAELDLCVPVLDRPEFEARFPGSPRRYVRLRDGEWIIGCTLLVNPTALARNREMVERVFAARRSQLGMARLLGAWFTLRFVTKRLGVGQIERKCLDLLGCTGGAIRGCEPEVAFDVDYPDDYRYAVARFQAARAGPRATGVHGGTAARIYLPGG